MLQQAPVDCLISYVGLRKYSLSTIGHDTPLRIFLNNEPIFQLGLLDQVVLTTSFLLE